MLWQQSSDRIASGRAALAKLGKFMRAARGCGWIWNNSHQFGSYHCNCGVERPHSCRPGQVSDPG